MKKRLKSYEKLSQMPACKACGVIAGSCLYEAIGQECKWEEQKDDGSNY